MASRLVAAPGCAETPRVLAFRSGERHYSNGKPCIHGHLSPRFVNNSMCVQCNTEKMRRQRRDPELRKRINARKNRYSRSHTANVLLTLAKRRAADVGVPFDLVLADIVIPKTCPVLGIPIEVGEGKVHSSSPTLDRIRPDKGYVRGNVAVISHRANMLKSNASPEELRAVADWLERQL